MWVYCRLMKEAGIEAKQAKEKNIQARHVRKVQRVCYVTWDFNEEPQVLGWVG